MMDELQKSDAQFSQPRSRGFVDKAIVESGVKLMTQLKARILVLEKENAKLKRRWRQHLEDCRADVKGRQWLAEKQLERIRKEGITDSDP